MLRFPVPPMRAVSGPLPIDDERWAFEVKWDGYRTIAFVDGGHVQLQSSNLLDVSPRYPELHGLGARVRVPRAVLDGELVVLDDRGRPRFELIQRHERPVTYVLFDLLEVDGLELLTSPYEHRRARLDEVVEPGPGCIITAHHVGHGPDLLAAATAQELEGLVAKRLGSTYVPGKRSPAWRKVKNRRRQELVVGGFMPGQGNRTGWFGSLLVGYHEDGRLRFGGGVGSGFDQRTLDELTATLERLRTDRCPFDPVPPPPVRRLARWVRPELVVEVEFSEWTSDGVVRQATFLGVRTDKAAHDVVREPS